MSDVTEGGSPFKMNTGQLLPRGRLLLESQTPISLKCPGRREGKHRQLPLDGPPLFAVLNPPGNSNSGKKLFEPEPASLQGARDLILSPLCCCD